MSRLWLAMLSLALVAFANAASAGDLAAVDDFKRLCMDTHADATAAFGAADAAGWTASTEQGEDYAEISGNPDGRLTELGMPDFRAITVSIPTGPKPIKACYMIAKADFEAAADAFGALLAQPAASQSDGVRTWEMFAIDGSYRPLSQFTSGQWAQLSLHNPAITVTVTRSDTAGYVILHYTEDPVLNVAPAQPIASTAGDVSHFSAWIVQGVRRIPLAGEIHLKKAPFSFEFRGSRLLGYSVASSLDSHALAGKTSDADLQEVFNRFGIGAENRLATTLFINVSHASSPDTVLTNHLWEGSDPELGGPQFESYLLSVGGIATARHDIDKVVVIGEDQPEISLRQWSRGPIYILIAGRPPTEDQPAVDPKYATLVFD